MAWPNDGDRDVRDLVDGVSYERDAVNTVQHVKVFDAMDIQDPHRPNIRDIMRPRRVAIHLTNNVVTHVSIYGKSVRRNGGLGVKEKIRYYGHRPAPGIKEPEWLIKLVSELGFRWPGRTCVDAHVPAGSDRFA